MQTRKAVENERVPSGRPYYKWGRNGVFGRGLFDCEENGGEKVGCGGLRVGAKVSAQPLCLIDVLYIFTNRRKVIT